MKKKSAFFVFVLLWLFAFPVAADEKSREEEAGLTPDQYFYFVDRWGEQLEHALTFSKKEEARLWAAQAEERVAEVQAVLAKGKEGYVYELLRDYLAALQEASHRTAEVLTEEDSSEAIQQVKAAVASAQQAALQLQEELDEGELQKVKEEVMQSKAVIRVVEKLPPEEVQAYREKGLGYGQIAVITALAQAGEVQEEQVLEALMAGKGFGQIAAELGVKVGEALKETFAANPEFASAARQKEKNRKGKTAEKMRPEHAGPPVDHDNDSSEEETAADGAADDDEVNGDEVVEEAEDSESFEAPEREKKSVTERGRSEERKSDRRAQNGSKQKEEHADAGKRKEESDGDDDGEQKEDEGQPALNPEETDASQLPETEEDDRSFADAPEQAEEEEAPGEKVAEKEAQTEENIGKAPRSDGMEDEINVENGEDE